MARNGGSASEEEKGGRSRLLGNLVHRDDEFRNFKEGEQKLGHSADSESGEPQSFNYILDSNTFLKGLRSFSVLPFQRFRTLRLVKTATTQRGLP